MKKNPLALLDQLNSVLLDIEHAQRLIDHGRGMWETDNKRMLAQLPESFKEALDRKQAQVDERRAVLEQAYVAFAQQN